MTDAFDAQLEQVERALKIINTIENNPELQSRTFDLLFGGAPAQAPPPRRKPATPPGGGSSDDGKESTPDGSNGRSRSSKKSSKVSVSQDKSLDTAPNGVQSWKDFAAEKKPSSIPDKNVVAVYWLLEVANHAKATINKVYTLFLDVAWKPPSDPKNAAQQAGSKGFLDTVDSEDIKLTPRGTGLVKNDLPRAEKK